MHRAVIIPAAGSGSRLGSILPKLLVPVNGRPMVEYLLDLYTPHADRFVVVVSPAAFDAVAGLVRPRFPDVALVVQEQPTGMLDAILLAGRHVIDGCPGPDGGAPRANDDVRRERAQRASHASGAGPKGPRERACRGDRRGEAPRRRNDARPQRVLITWCDQVAMTRATIDAVVAAAASTPEPSIVLPTCRGRDPYVHLQRDATGRVVDVLHRREGDAMPELGESDAGVFDLSLQAFEEWLPEYAAAPAVGARTGERNFLPFVSWVGRRGTVVTIPCQEPEEAIGINTPGELARIEGHLKARSQQQ